MVRPLGDEARNIVGRGQIYPFRKPLDMQISDLLHISFAPCEM